MPSIAKHENLLSLPPTVPLIPQQAGVDEKVDNPASFPSVAAIGNKSREGAIVNKSVCGNYGDLLVVGLGRTQDVVLPNPGA